MTNRRRPPGRALGAEDEQPAEQRIVFALDTPAPDDAKPAPGDRTQASPPTRVRTEWTARPATPRDAELLQIPHGAIVLDILRTVLAPDGTVVKATRTLCPGTRTVLQHAYTLDIHTSTSATHNLRTTRTPPTGRPSQDRAP